jgi:hypothetical protein
VIGQSTKDAGAPASQPWGIDNLLSTIFHSVFNLGELRLQQNLPTDLVRLVTGSQPIPIW